MLIINADILFSLLIYNYILAVIFTIGVDSEYKYSWSDLILLIPYFALITFVVIGIKVCIIDYIMRSK